MIIRRHHLDEMPERYCARGSRRWFARVGLDWTDFVLHGIDDEILIATGDAQAIRLVEHMRQKYE